MPFPSETIKNLSASQPLHVGFIQNLFVSDRALVEFVTLLIVPVADIFESTEPRPAVAPERVLCDGHGAPPKATNEDIPLRQTRAHHCGV